MAQRDERLYLTEILEAIDRVLEYTTAGRAFFFGDPKTQDAVIRNVEIMGEAGRSLSAGIRDAHPEVPWNKIAGTSDRVIQQYFNVDLDIVWEAVQRDLPALKQIVGAALNEPSA